MESMEGADIGQSGGGGKKRDGMEIEIISGGRSGGQRSVFESNDGRRSGTIN